MTLNNESINRLRQIKNQLPNNAPPANKKNIPKANSTHHKLHKIETEEDPSELFHALIDVSPDGEIPPHLINRLKEIESNKLSIKSPSASTHSIDNDQIKKRSSKQKTSDTEEEYLYTYFKSLILEEEV